MKRADDHPLSLSHTGSFDLDVPADKSHRQRRGRRRRLARLARLWPLVSILLLLLGPVVAFGAWRTAQAAHDDHVQLRFEEALGERIQAIREQLAAYGEVLHSLHGLYDASEEVTADEFGTFTRQARGRHPCIEAVAWAPRVGAGDSGGYDRSGFRLRFIHPREQQRHLFELAVHESDRLEAAIEQAHETSRPTLSAPLHPRGDGPDEDAYGLLALAVLAPEDGDEAGAVLGTVLLTFRYADLLAPEPKSASPLMTLALHDVTPGEAVQRAAVDAALPAADSDIRAKRELQIAGRTWSFSAVPTRNFLALHRTREPLGIAAVVLLVWELLAALLLALSHASRSNAVRRQGRNVSRIMQSLGEGVVVAGADGSVRLTNAAARMLIGGVLDEADAATFQRAVRFVRARTKQPFGPEQTPLERAMRGETFDQYACIVYTPARPDGVPVSVSGSPLRDEWGKLLGGVLAIRDDTERHASEEALRAKDAALRARQIEMDLASSVQKRFYPEAPPAIPGLDMAGAVKPAEETCGDYYDYLELPDGSLLLAVGDVSGHGLGPALVMAETRAYVRSLARAGYDPQAILDRCNDQLCQDLADDLFVTMLLIRIAPEGRRLSFASAGHTPALLVSSDGHLQRVMGQTGPPLGVVEGHAYGMESGIGFADDSVLVLMTDGVTEAASADEEPFDERGVLEVVTANRHRPANDIVREIGSALARHAGERLRRDDVTLVVCKRVAVIPSTLAERRPLPLRGER